MKIKLIFVLVVFMTTHSNSQNDFDVLEKNMPFNKLATSFTIDVVGAGESLAMYHWQKFIEKHKGTTYVISYGEGNIELESQHVAFPLLNNQLVTMHSRFSPNNTESGVLMTIWIELPDGTYYSSKTDPDSGKKIKNWLLAFHQELKELNRTH
ncbi:MAG: hypothetical protein WA749_02495 [Gelidibacter sp.]